MRVTLNGQPKDIAPTLTLSVLVRQLGRDPRHIVAEINGEIVPRDSWDRTRLKDHDTIELLNFVGGGERGEDAPLVIAGKSFGNRFFLGTGKFKNKADLQESITASGTEMVTVALRRIDLDRHEDNILEYIPSEVTVMVNTSGARSAQEAIRIARLARECGYGNWIKIEVINDTKYLLPDNTQTVIATKTLAREGFIVLPYVSPDLYAARALQEAGAAAVMPLGSLIGSNQGLLSKEWIHILIKEIDLPIIVDAGIGAPSQAAEAMEMGAAAVLVNTAVATANAPARLARAFSLAVRSGRLGYLSGLPPRRSAAHASSPLTHLLSGLEAP